MSCQGHRLLQPIFIIQVRLKLPKNRLTRFMFVMLYVKPKLRLSRAGIMIIIEIGMWVCYNLSLKE